MSLSNKDKQNNVRWQLIAFDTIAYAIVIWFSFILYPSGKAPADLVAAMSAVFWSINLVTRLLFKIYTQVWRYGGIQTYIRLICADAVAFPVFYIVKKIAFPDTKSFAICVMAACLYLLTGLSMRMGYRYAYKFGNADSALGKFLRFVLKVVTFGSIEPISIPGNKKIKVAVVGAGSVGITLVDELTQNPASAYHPVCFIDKDREKIGREIHNLPVLEAGNATTLADLEANGIQEVIIAIPGTEREKRIELYNYYKDAGYKIKAYDFPAVENATGKKRRLREFDIEELLFRKTLDVLNDKTISYYEGKTILITGGGGSIGSELCRQIAGMNPKKLVILDVYENGAYDVQQELKLSHNDVEVKVEIASVVNEKALDRIFEEYKPDIVLNAAAHKHVPLMEKNCVEAIENNVFGTLNTVKMCVKHGVKRMIMVSTDKAVNPTNVMGATKRMCELIVGNYAKKNLTTTFSITRFGNVLGSAGSVIPLFKRQIASGGPVTITDKRIIRYFMTIPEASQLVLTSGAMAKNGELFVLDMGQPVKIYDLAVNMIKLMGMKPDVDIEMVETGLRPGEKLYEELLVKTEELDKTENELIYIERDEPISDAELEEKLDILSKALDGDDESAKAALKQVVPTFRSPEEVNSEAEKAEEMKQSR